MEVKKFLEMLENEGLEATKVTANKFGYEEDAYSIGNEDSPIKPLVYERQILEMPEDKALEFINKHLKETPEFSLDQIMNKEYILENVQCAIRHRTEDESILKLPVRGDLELYYKVKIDNTNDGEASFKVKQDMIERLDISKMEINEAAKKNTAKDAKIVPMFDMLCEMTGNDELMNQDVVQMYVATTKRNINGAAVMECEDIINDFCRSKGFKGVAIIPSSIHEVLLLPVTEELDAENINSMIKQINETQVAPEEVLSDHLYYNYI